MGKISRFTFIGVINTIVDITILNILVYFGITGFIYVFNTEIFLANAISVGIAINISFLLHKNITFRSNSENIHVEWPLFILATVSGVIIFQIFLFTYIYNGFLLQYNQFINVNVAKILVTIGSAIWNFLWYDKIFKL